MLTSASLPEETPTSNPYGADWLRVLTALGDALTAVDRNVLPDVFGAYERMHEAAGMGPMVWGGKLNGLAFTCSGNPTRLTAGDVDLVALARTLAGLARSLGESEQRFTVWKASDDVLRGVRRIHLYGLKRSIEIVSQQLEAGEADLSSRGLQATADRRSSLAQLTREYSAELVVLGLTDQEVA